MEISGVTIYEHTVYLLRVQLDCPTQTTADVFATSCNLAQCINDGRGSL